MPYFYYVESMQALRPGGLSKDPEYYKQMRRDGVANPDDPDNKARHEAPLLPMRLPRVKDDNPHKDKKPLNEL